MTKPTPGEAIFATVEDAWRHHTGGKPLTAIPSSFVGKYKGAFEMGFYLARWVKAPEEKGSGS